jgi:hypothetical protein
MGETFMRRILQLALAVHLIASVAHSQRSIRHIDFKNFTYSPSCLEKQQVSVKSGTYRGNLGDPSGDTVYFSVVDVVYGDLTGDREDEAVVITTCNTGGSGQFTDGIIFTMRRGKPAELDTLGMGDRAEDGIEGARIENGLLKVARYGKTTAARLCCPEYVETRAFRLRGAELVQVGKPTRKRFESDQVVLKAKRIRFARGRTSAVLTGSGRDGDAYVLNVRAGQTMLVHVTSKGDSAAVEVVDRNGNAVAGNSQPNDWSGKMPENGDYRIIVRLTKGATAYTLEVTIR